MTTKEFSLYQAQLAPSRLHFCAALGIGRRSGDAYALGRSPIPLTGALAIAAIEAGIAPAGERAADGKKMAA